MQIFYGGSTVNVRGQVAGNPFPSKRGDTQGWTPAVARRLTRWLMSIDAMQLDGIGVAFTLTLRDCPPTAAEWGKLVKRFCQAAREQSGASRITYVTEWTRRKVPHLHGFGSFPPPTNPIADLREFWLKVAAPYGAGPHGQHLTISTDSGGWWKYLSKHSARSVKHYQRSGSPPGWSKTGRMWGKLGYWPLVRPFSVVGLSEGDRYALRRLMCRYSAAVAASRGDIDGVKYWKRYRAKVASYKGVTEWAPAGLVLSMVEAVAPSASLCYQDTGEILTFDEARALTVPGVDRSEQCPGRFPPVRMIPVR